MDDFQVTQLKINTNQFAAAFRKRNKSLPEDGRETSAESDSPQHTVSNDVSLESSDVKSVFSSRVKIEPTEAIGMASY